MLTMNAISRRGVLDMALSGLGAAALAGALPVAAMAQTADVASLRIATIGAGREGGALGTLFAKAGHKVMFSSRHPEALKDLVAKAGPNASAGTVAEAVAFGNVVLLVVPYGAVEGIGRDFGAPLCAKQLVLDVSNPVARRDGDDLVKRIDEMGGPGLATARFLPGVSLVRGFNALGSGGLTSTRPAGEPLGIPIASDDPKAVALATALIKELGFEAVLVGGLAKGKYLVPGTPLAGAHTPAEIREIAAKLS